MAAFAAMDARKFLDTSAAMIIDEVQRQPGLLSYIQGIVDTDSERRFFLSGSSQFQMMQHVTQSLAGRSALLELMPLSYGEISSLAADMPLSELLFKGFFPAIWSRQLRPSVYYRNYVKTYVERDVRSLLNVKDLLQFSTFIRLCAGRVGSILKVSELANEVGVAANTIGAWLSVLEASYIITLVRPYSANLNKRLIRSPKLYFVDTGLAAYLLGIDTPERMDVDAMRGHLFENFVVMEILKQLYNHGKDNVLYFYRDSNGNEVDLLVPTSEGLKCFEIKSSQTFHPDFEKGLCKFLSVVKEPVAKSAIVYAGSLESTSAPVGLINYRHLCAI